MIPGLLAGLIAALLVGLLWWCLPFCRECTNPVGWVWVTLDTGVAHLCCWKCATRVWRRRRARGVSASPSRGRA